MSVNLASAVVKKPEFAGLFRVQRELSALVFSDTNHPALPKRPWLSETTTPSCGCNKPVLQQAPHSQLVFLHRLENILLVFRFKFLCLVSFALKTTASFYYYPIWMNVLENCSMKLKRVFIFFLRRSETQYMSEY